MYRVKDLKNLLFFDMETCPETTWEKLSENKKKIWLEKHHFKFFQLEIETRKKKLALSRGPEEGDYYILPVDIKTPTLEEIYIKYSPLIAEFGKIWCISFGALDEKNDIVVDTLQSDNEKEMIDGFLQILHKFSHLNLSGYNIGEFDIPYLLKRMWKNGIISNYPTQLQLKDAKPWTVKHVDFMIDWKNLMREAVPLALLCEELNVPTPKDKFNNDEFTTLLMAGKISKEDGIEYCEKDVVAVAKCMLAVASDSSNYDGGESVKSSSKWTKK